MRALLDTHVWLWLLGDPKRLRPAARRTLAAADELVVSVASVWEVTIKDSLGRISLAVPLSELLASSRAEMGARVLSVEAGHVLALRQLPVHHRDPFDRLLVAQARSEHLTLVTADRALAAYDVDLLDPS